MDYFHLYVFSSYFSLLVSCALLCTFSSAVFHCITITVFCVGCESVASSFYHEHAGSDCSEKAAYNLSGNVH
jgi:hypothetical protein